MSTVEDSVSLNLFSTHLLDLHTKAKAQSLTSAERIEYERVRDDIARMLVFAQHLICRPGEKFRQALRVVIELAVSVDDSGAIAEGKTLNISAGGFAATLSAPLANGTNVGVKLALPFGAPIVGRAQVVGSSPAGNGCRASFAFQELAQSEVDLLEVLVFDGVLPQLSSILGMSQPQRGSSASG